MQQSYSLHDCRATRMELAGSTLSFYFENGVFLLPAEGSEVQRSGPARLDIPILDMDIDGISIYIYSPHRGRVVRREWEAGNFIDAVNDGSFEVEFLTEYTAYRSLLYRCTLWFNTPPYHHDCDIELNTFGAELHFT